MELKYLGMESVKEGNNGKGIRTLFKLQCEKMRFFGGTFLHKNVIYQNSLILSVNRNFV